MKVAPYLFFDGTCEDAVKFYARVLDAKIGMTVYYKDMPGERKPPAEWLGKIAHTRFAIGDQSIMASDATPEHYRKPQGYSINLNVDTPDEADRIYKELSADAQVIEMPIGETFWAHRFGSFVDKFGTSWMINCEKQM